MKLRQVTRPALGLTATLVALAANANEPLGESHHLQSDHPTTATLLQDANDSHALAAEMQWAGAGSQGPSIELPPADHQPALDSQESEEPSSYDFDQFIVWLRESLYQTDSAAEPAPETSPEGAPEAGLEPAPEAAPETPPPAFVLEPGEEMVVPQELDSSGIDQTEETDGSIASGYVPDSLAAFALTWGLVEGEPEPSAVFEPSQASPPEEPSAPATDDRYDATAAAMAAEDVSGAIAWASSIPEEDYRSRAMRVIGYEAARTDPILCINLALQLPASTETQQLLSHGVSQWAAAEPFQAERWAEETGEARNTLLAKVAVSVAEADPPTAATWAATLLQPGEVQNATVVSIVQRWAQQAPEACANWLALFSESPLQTDATQELVAIWGHQDAGGLARWLENLPEGSLQGAAHRALRVLDDDPSVFSEDRVIE